MRNRKSLATTIALLLLSVTVVAQGGNGRDLALAVSVSGAASSDGSAPVTASDTLGIQVTSPLGTLAGRAVMIAVDRRSRDSVSNLALPGEPGALVVGSGLSFLVDGEGVQAAMIPGPASLGAQGYSVTVPVGSLGLQAGQSLFIQAAVIDLGAPNLLAVSAGVRLDTLAPALQATVFGSTNAADAIHGYGMHLVDLNGDGAQEMILGAPQAPALGVARAGEVRILWGPDQLQVTTLTAPGPQTDAAFGNIIRSGDLNGDGAIDLVIGARYEASSGTPQVGVVYVFYGPQFTQVQRLDAPVVERGRMGHGVAVVDWNGDGFADIAAGAPKAGRLGLDDVGAVHLFLGPTFAQTVTLENPAPVFGAKFGYALSAADFDGNGQEELVVGAPFHHVASDDATGVIYVYRGSAVPSQTLSQAEDHEAFLGHVFSVADFNQDGYPDLAAGAEFDDHALVDAGSVHVFYGPHLVTRIEVTSPAPIAGAGFGSDVASGDVNGDGYPDLVAGEFYAPVNGLALAGRGWVVYGPTFDQGTPLEAPDPAVGAFAGRKMACGDVDGNGYADAFLGAPFASPGGSHYQGAVYHFE